MSVIRLEPPKHTGHVLQYVRTAAACLQVLLTSAVALRIFGLL